MKGEKLVTFLQTFRGLSSCNGGGKPVLVEPTAGRAGEACGLEGGIATGADNESSFEDIRLISTISWDSASGIRQWRLAELGP